jgi:hypothetical protein
MKYEERIPGSERVTTVKLTLVRQSDHRQSVYTWWHARGELKSLRTFFGASSKPYNDNFKRFRQFAEISSCAVDIVTIDDLEDYMRSLIGRDFEVLTWKNPERVDAKSNPWDEFIFLQMYPK